MFASPNLIQKVIFGISALQVATVADTAHMQGGAGLRPMCTGSAAAAALVATKRRARASAAAAAAARAAAAGKAVASGSSFLPPLLPPSGALAPLLAACGCSLERAACSVAECSNTVSCSTFRAAAGCSAARQKTGCLPSGSMSALADAFNGTGIRDHDLSTCCAAGAGTAGDVGSRGVHRRALQGGAALSPALAAYAGTPCGSALSVAPAAQCKA